MSPPLVEKMSPAMGQPVAPSSSALHERPEVELLLGTARSGPDTIGDEQIRTLLQRDLDWSYLLGLARRHGLLPLLSRRLLAFPNALAESVRNQLQDHDRLNILHSLHLTGELLKLLKLFESARIAVIPYKGPVLAASLYGDLASREFIDLDLLVHEHDLAGARELLISQGYHAEYQLTKAQERAFRRYQNAFLCARASDGVLVEIHWRFIERFFSFPLDPEPLWERRLPITLGGREILTLAPEDLLLVLCAHGCKHLWAALKWIADVARLIHVHPRLNWDSVLAQAERLGSSRMLFLGLFLAWDLLGTELPVEIQKRAWADRAVPALAAQVREELFQDAPGPASLAKMCRFHLRARERIRDRLHYCLDLALTPTLGDWASLSLPEDLFFLYYLLRPIRLAGKYGAQLFTLAPRALRNPR